ncbi:hypothetical protein I3843_08G148300 [Carya illinoinensis]|nr:hypothetical protein I3843_08G148300 [Carya illinoinensis]KAG7968312.1 hypothetical protein I3843_08G148300 [Carya illinoinensis]KAG7968313.1 hypothetical protein I3843_08G148300 [Carya illinoinensis]KAG7968314.1 hypothetical protein I3843_08G148300 [Carya illinoinensis]
MEKSSTIDQKVATTASVTNGNQNVEIHQLDQTKANTLSRGINGNRHSKLIISINEMVGSNLDPPFIDQCCIYKIPTFLRRLNEKAYTPQVISIGPFHHGNKSLESMEKLKVKYFKIFLQRNHINMEILVNNIKLLEKKVRGCYAETFNDLTSDDFVKLILVDGCFLIEFFDSLFWEGFENVIYENRTLLNRTSLSTMMTDLKLLENQLPLLVLKKLFSHANSYRHPSFTLLAFGIFYIGENDDSEFLQNLERNARHFVDLARAILLLSSRNPVQPDESKDLPSADHLNPTSQLHEIGVKFKESSYKCLLDLTRHLRHLSGFTRAFFLPLSRKPVPPDESNDLLSADHLHSASQLHEAGVKFKVSPSKCLLDLKFIKGTFEIPCIKLYDSTETIYRNIIAFEQCHYPYDPQFTNYIGLLNFLINTPKDVDLLIRKKIIINWLGNSDAVASFVNNLDTNVLYDGSRSNYRGLFRDLNAFFEDPKHTWKATLKSDYFSTPWRIASTAAAVILLLLTLGQFICSIIQVVKM